MKVAGVDHEFAAIPGVMEGMLEIILNLKQVRFIKTVESADSEKVRVSVAGQTELTAGYISNFLTNFKVLNPDLVICRLDADVKLQIELTIGKGRGYVPAEENRPADAEFDRFDPHTDQECKIFGRKLPCRAENRLRETQLGDYDGRFHSPERCTERGC